MPFHMKFNPLVSALLLALPWLSGCVKHTGLIYLNDPGIHYLNDDSVYSIAQAPKGKGAVYYGPYRLEDYRVRPFDNLMIRANTFETSSLNLFNQAGGSSNSSLFGPAGIYLSSYTVDENGLVDMPVVGKVKVAGLTLGQIKDTLDKKLRPVVNQPFSVVKMTNFRFTVLGEVQNPGTHYVYDDRVTLFQAIGIAGDLTDFAERSRVKIIREQEGRSEVVLLDLNKPEMLASEYYFVRPNDVIYVEPVQVRAVDINSRSVSLIISSLSIAATLANLLINQLSRN
jgi:polysaccharide export outer membrane protein